MNKFLSCTLLFTTLTLHSCNPENAGQGSNSPASMDDSSRAIIDRAIAFAGGYDAWQQKKSISFDKKSTSYDSTGKIVRQTDMHLDYELKPVYRARLSYKVNDTAILLIHDGEKARKFYNGKVSEEQTDIDAAWNSGFGSQFVMCMPFKLKDAGIQAAYIGIVKLNDGKPAQVVKTSYKKGAGSNPEHIWYYYFEPGTGKLLANSLNGKDNYWDYTRYESFDRSGGLLMPAVRKGYKASKMNEPGSFISESRHFNIVFDKTFSEGHFRIKDAN